MSRVGLQAISRPPCFPTSRSARDTTDISQPGKIQRRQWNNLTTSQRQKSGMHYDEMGVERGVDACQVNIVIVH